MPIDVIKKQMPALLASLPGSRQSAKQRFERAAIGIAMSPMVSNCDPSSVFKCIYTCARLDINPDPALHLAAIVPFKNSRKGCTEATLIIEYRGLIELAKRADPNLSIRADTVYENDTYHLTSGLDENLVITKRWWEGGKEPGKPVFSYVISQQGGGRPQMVIISALEGEKIGKASKAGMRPGTPWKDHFERMCEKTAVRRSSRFWRLDPDKEETKQFREAIEYDENTGDQPDIIDAVGAVTANVGSEAEEPMPAEGTHRRTQKAAVTAKPEGKNLASPSGGPDLAAERKSLMDIAENVIGKFGYVAAPEDIRGMVLKVVHYVLGGTLEEATFDQMMSARESLRTITADVIAGIFKRSAEPNGGAGG